MKSHNFIFIITIFISCCLLKFTQAWWDITHMTIAAIAESQMKPEHVDKLNSYLKIYEFNYPEMTNLINSTTFPDHVRCKNSDTLDCKGLPFSDVATMFNGFHTSQIPYTDPVQDIDLFNVRRPLTMPGNSEGIVFFLESVKTHVEAMAENNCSKELCPVQMGSDFSWNFILRYYLHMFGDIHMPCHLGSGVSIEFPLGCDFCQLIKMEKPFPTDYNITEDGKDSFHQYMDGIGYTSYGRWPNLSDKQIRDNAEKYMKEYPRSVFQDELNLDVWDFKAIANESFIIHNQIYDDINFFDFKKIEKLSLDDTLDKKFQDILKKRVTLCGYRMAKGLTYYAESLPEIDADIFSLLNDQKLSNENNNTVVIILAILAVIFLIATCISSYSLYKAKANKVS